MKKLIEKIKMWFRQRKAAKLPVLFCIHGFGVRRTIELDPLKTYFENKGHTVITMELFDPRDEQDNDPDVWIRRAKDKLEPLIAANRCVWLVGFSMGGVIASQLASLYPVQRVVLLAPAFEYVTLQTVKNVAETAVRSIINRPKQADPEVLVMPDSFALTFRSVVASCKDSVTKITQPVLFIHGSDDEVIPVRSSENAYAKVPHDQKMLLVIEGVLHRVLDDEKHNQDILHLIDDFFHGRLIRDMTD